MAGAEVGAGKAARVRVRPRCPDCGKRIRGPNHAEGAHHKGTVAKNR